MTVMTEAIGAELAIRAALNEIIKHIASTALDANLKRLEDDAVSIKDADMKTGFIRALLSIQRDQR